MRELLRASGRWAFASAAFSVVVIVVSVALAPLSLGFSPTFATINGVVIGLIAVSASFSALIFFASAILWREIARRIPSLDEHALFMTVGCASAYVIVLSVAHFPDPPWLGSPAEVLSQLGMTIAFVLPRFIVPSLRPGVFLASSLNAASAV